MLVPRDAFLSGNVTLEGLLLTMPPPLLALMKRTVGTYGRRFQISLEDDLQGDEVHMMLKGASDYARSREMPSSHGDAKDAPAAQETRLYSASAPAEAAAPAPAPAVPGAAVPGAPLPAGTGTLYSASSLPVGTSARSGGHGEQQHGMQQHGMHAVRTVLARLGAWATAVCRAGPILPTTSVTPKKSV